MSETTEKDRKRPLRLSRPGRLELKKTVETGQVRQSFSHGRSKAVTVEVKKKRTYAPDKGGRMTEVKPGDERAESLGTAVFGRGEQGATVEETRPGIVRALTDEERAARARAVRGAVSSHDGVTSVRQEQDEARRARDVAQRDEAQRRADEEARAAEEARLSAERDREETEQRAREEARRAREDARRADEEARRKAEEELRQRVAERTAARLSTREPVPEAEEEEAAPRRGRGKTTARRQPAAPRRMEPRRRAGKMTVTAALNEEEERVRSLAALKRAREREKERQRSLELQEAPSKVIRDVVIPETITVQDLANRMAERSADVIKALMNMGVMATINHVIEADTAELIVAEFGHITKRVAESDVEIGLEGTPDEEVMLLPRPPVVTVMGHVDHGKTSLLDALRETDVASREAGGITQHIGAYQVKLNSGQRITFIDTPGHEAFTAMRSRGAKVTDIVVLVVAADDSVQPQTIEAINHARAASVSIIVAINKIDRPGADPARVRNDLLAHEIVTEEFGGDVLAVEVSATERTNLDRLEEAILLQAELLELRANPARSAQGVVIESRLDRGRGPVATILVRRGTLRVGDVFIAGSEWGRVRAMLDDKGESVAEAGPAMPAQVLGLNGMPDAGDEISVVAGDSRARDVTEFRQRKQREARVAGETRGSVEEIMTELAEAKADVLALVVKADARGSVEALTSAIQKLSTEEVTAQILHEGVGGINESDVALAKASNGLIIGFNVRAMPQAREIARRDDVDIRYYSVIYEVLDDVKAILSGMLKPAEHEHFLGNAEIRQVFSISKVGKVAGCRVTEGQVRRAAKVRLLRDSVVIYDGSLKSLKRFKGEVRDVKEGFECGMAFENYQDLQEGDIVECYEVEEVARAL